MNTPDLMKVALLVEIELAPGRATHGYALLGALEETGLRPSMTTGGVYRKLRDMSDEGLVESIWDTPERGPARKVYRLTDTGRERLYWDMLPELEDYDQSVGRLFRQTRKMARSWSQR